MRKFSLFVLLASSAVPAMAQSVDDGARQSRRDAQEERSDNRPQRAERSEHREAREQPQRQVQAERQQSDRQGNESAAPAMRERIQQARQQSAEQQGQSARSERFERYQQRQIQQQVQGEAIRNERLERNRQRQLGANEEGLGGGLVPRQSRIRTIPPTTPEVGQQGPVREDVRFGTRNERHDQNRWTSHWRDDHRYDWRRHRNHHRSIFRIGFYYDPFGYSYRRFGIGSYLYPNYYQSSFWISDPWQYRLPPAYGPYRWVRYHNDAVLIDTWTGEVVDVIYGFFW